MSVKQKRFPANTKLDLLTFLNDKKVNSELYAFLQGISYAKEGKTVVYKKSMPTQAEICKKLNIASPKTYRSHFKYLVDRGFVVLAEDKDYYLELPNVEDVYFLIPLDTLQYLNDNCKEHVIKIYVYLGQRFKYGLSKGSSYEFSSEELGEHIGIRVRNYARGYEIINNALALLSNSGLIEYVSFYDGATQKKKLLNFSLEVKKSEEKGG